MQRALDQLMRFASIGLLLVVAMGCSDPPDETSNTSPVGAEDAGLVPGCDSTIPLSQFCPTPCGNWTDALHFACTHQGDMAPSPPVVGDCFDGYYSETIYGLDYLNIIFYDKQTLEFSGAVLRGNEGKRACVGKIPSIRACGENHPDCTAGGGADSAPE
jgi:hypothetical protein